MGIDDGRERPLVAGVHRRSYALAGAQLLADPLVDQHVRVDGDSHGEHDPGNARQRQCTPESGEPGEHVGDVDEQRNVGEHTGAAVIKGHEDDDQTAADSERQHALADRVAAERRTDRALFGDRHRSRQRARPQHDRQIA